MADVTDIKWRTWTPPSPVAGQRGRPRRTGADDQRRRPAAPAAPKKTPPQPDDHHIDEYI